MDLVLILLLASYCASCAAKGGGGRGGSRGSSSHTSFGGSRGKSSSFSIHSITSSASKMHISGKGGDKVVTIKSGPFAGRTSGGGTRSEIYGNSMYGSGYSRGSSLGVDGRNFPFNFYPVVWHPPGTYYPPYMLSSEADRYGTPENTTRPGGVLTSVPFQNTDRTSTFRFMADNETVLAVTRQIMSSCRSSLADPSVTPFPTPYSSGSTVPLPEQAVQYYRASSAVLTMDGYNNTAAFGSDPNATFTPLPANTNLTLLHCLNTTIGSTIPIAEKTGLTAGAIAGIVVGSIAGFVVMTYLAVVLVRIVKKYISRRRRGKSATDENQRTNYADDKTRPTSDEEALGPSQDSKLALKHSGPGSLPLLSPHEPAGSRTPSPSPLDSWAQSELVKEPLLTHGSTTDPSMR